MLETMTALMFAPALGSPIGTIPPPTRQDIATFYSRRGCRGSVMGTAVEYSSRFDRMQGLYPSYRRPDHSCINTGVAFSAGTAALRCNWEDVCTLPTVPVIGPPAPAPSPPHQGGIMPGGGDSGAPPPIEAPPPDTLEDALEEESQCQQQENEVDAGAENLANQIRRNILEWSTQIDPGGPIPEWGGAIYRDNQDQIRISSQLDFGDPDDAPDGAAGEVFITIPPAALAHNGGEFLGFIHNHNFSNVPSAGDWRLFQYYLDNSSYFGTNSGVFAMYLLGADGRLYEFNDGDQRYVQGTLGEQLLSDGNLARNGECGRRIEGNS